MIRIDVPVISEKKNRHALSARIITERGRIVFPGSMWFAVSGEDPRFSPGLSDAFVVGIVAVAMKMGEDVEVEGNVSARLAHGLEHYQNILNTWWPETFKPVDIQYAQLDDRRDHPLPGGVGCTFSGGLDSFHAVVEMLPAHMKIKSFNISHAMMINGFDQLVDLEHRGLAKHMHRIFSPLLADWGVKLLMVDTNLRMFRSAAMIQLELINSYSSFLASCAHALGGVFGRFGISGHGNYSYAELEPFGSHPALDHHLSTDQLQIMHAGSSKTRAGKLEMVADLPAVQNNLRVCFRPLSFDRQTGRVVNCGKCEKCIRTLTALMIMDKLDAFTTFPRVFPVEQYQRPEILATMHDAFLQDLVNLSKRKGRNSWISSLNAAREIRAAKDSKK